jgi:hypothetical protein
VRSGILVVILITEPLWEPITESSFAEGCDDSVDVVLDAEADCVCACRLVARLVRGCGVIALARTSCRRPGVEEKANVGIGAPAVPR